MGYMLYCFLKSYIIGTCQNWLSHRIQLRIHNKWKISQIYLCSLRGYNIWLPVCEDWSFSLLVGYTFYVLSCFDLNIKIFYFYDTALFCLISAVKYNSRQQCCDNCWRNWLRENYSVNSGRLMSIATMSWNVGQQSTGIIIVIVTLISSNQCKPYRAYSTTFKESLCYERKLLQQTVLCNNLLKVQHITLDEVETSSVSVLGQLIYHCCQIQMLNVTVFFSQISW